MISRCGTALVALAALLAPSQAHSQRLDPDSILAHVAFLATDALEGRAAGTDGFRWAARHAALAMRAAGVTPGVQGSDGPTYLQPFRVPGAVMRPPLESYNLIGIIQGTDATLRDEFVLIGAHLDGQGVRPDRLGGPGGVHNSANDNATGSALVLEIARVVAANPPARSVIVALWGAEEVGLVGSGYFVENPVVPLTNLRAVVNLDGVGRFDRSPDGVAEVYALGSDELCPGFGDAFREANERSGRLRLRTDDPNNWFSSSDHIHFHRRGIPAVFLTDLGSNDYHRPTDDVDRIDAQRLTQVGETAMALILRAGSLQPWPCDR